MADIKIQLTASLKNLGFSEDKISVDYPTHVKFGDYSINLAMAMAKAEKKNPMEVAESIVVQLQNDKFISNTFDKIQVVKPGFINFYLKNELLEQTLEVIIQQADLFGQSKKGQDKKIVVEYSSPNTNKPLHLGHLRNNFIGMALSNLFKSQGYDVVMTEIVNDRGIHICKSMLAYQLWGEGDSPEKSQMKSDHFVAKYYVMYSQKEKTKPELKEQAQELLRKWEAGDKEVRELWQKLNDWAETGYNQTYKKIGSHFDMHEYESKIFDKGREIVMKALGDNKVEKVEGDAVAIDLSEYKMGGRDDGKKILLRSDGTTMYITQDLYLALKRWQEHKPEKVFYVVADEQNYHFKVLFKILELFGNNWVKDRYVHVSYGMVNLPEGKMKSREGTVVDADNLIEEIETMAKAEILKREDGLTDKELETRATQIALSALKFYILKVDLKSTMTYDPKSSLDFEGDTGPYVQYTYARLMSILQKAGVGKLNSTYLPNEQEREVLVLLNRYEEIISSILSDLRVHRLPEYLLELSSAVNTWYAQHHVIKAESDVARQWRLLLVQAVGVILNHGLKILGIEPIERM